MRLISGGAIAQLKSCGKSGRRYRQRITVVIVTPEGINVGSSVVEVDIAGKPKILGDIPGNGYGVEAHLAIGASRVKVPIPGELYPLLIAFGDIVDPIRIDPADIAAYSDAVSESRGQMGHHCIGAVNDNTDLSPIVPFHIAAQEMVA